MDRQSDCFRSCLWSLGLAVAVVGCAHTRGAPVVAQRDGPAHTARAALVVAEVAARAWQEDAQLLFVENDAPLGENGASNAWGYLFHSAARQAWRNVAVADRRVHHEAPLTFPYPQPALTDEWIDSTRAVAAAELAGGAALRRAGAEVRHLVLSRGIFAETTAPPTWTVHYVAPGGDEHAFVVDAHDGHIVRRIQG